MGAVRRPGLAMRVRVAGNNRTWYLTPPGDEFYRITFGRPLIEFDRHLDSSRTFFEATTKSLLIISLL